MKTILLAVLFAVAGFGQNPPATGLRPVSSPVAGGACNNSQPAFYSAVDQKLYTCLAGVWSLPPSSGGSPSGAAGGLLTGSYPNPNPYNNGKPGSVNLTAATKLGETVSILEFGGSADSSTDNTAAIVAALAQAAVSGGQGFTIEFPCNPAAYGSYLITSPTFTSLHIPSHTTLRGSGRNGCPIIYQPSSNPGSVGSVFDAIGSSYVNIERLHIYTASTYPAQSTLLLAQSTTNAAQHITLRDALIEGYSTVAPVINLGSEVFNCDSTGISQHYAGQAVYYTAAYNYPSISGAGIGSVTDSNDSQAFRNCTFSSVANNVDNFVGVLEGATGNWTIQDSNFSGPATNGQTAAMVHLYGGTTVTNGPNLPILFENLHGENFQNGIKYDQSLSAAPFTYYNVTVDGLTLVNNTTPATPVYCEYGITGTTLYTYLQRNTSCYVNSFTTSKNSSSIYNVTAGLISEDFTTTINGTASGVNLVTPSSYQWTGLNSIGLNSGSAVSIAGVSTSAAVAGNTAINEQFIVSPNATAGTSGTTNQGSNYLKECGSFGDGTANQLACNETYVALGTGTTPNVTTYDLPVGTNTIGATTVRDLTGYLELLAPSIFLIGGSRIPIGSETVTFSATPTFSIYKALSEITLTNNITSFTLASGLSNGVHKSLNFCQNGTGGFTVTAPSNVHGLPVIGIVANKCSMYDLVYSGLQGAWETVGQGNQ